MLPGVTEDTPFDFAMVKSAVGATATMVSVSVDVLLAGVGSLVPAGGATLAVLTSVPVALGLSVAVTV